MREMLATVCGFALSGGIYWLSERQRLPAFASKCLKFMAFLAFWGIFITIMRLTSGWMP